jgi:hypothetical protein
VRVGFSHIRRKGRPDKPRLDFAGMSDMSTEARTRHLVDWAEWERRYYYDHAAYARWGYRVAQLAALILTSVTPVLVAITDLPAAVKALPAAIAAICLGASTLFDWRRNWVRWIEAAMAIELEQHLFRLKLKPYDADDEPRLATFAKRISDLIAAEVSGWKVLTSHDAAQDPARAQQGA